MIASSLLLSVLLAGGGECNSSPHCNRLGSAALNSGDVPAARALFAQQVDYAQTAVNEADEGSDGQRLLAALQIALNNAALAELRAGECLRARAWLDLADPAHRATQANRRMLGKNCNTPLDARTHTGEFWQYAGHGAWNTVSVREAGDEGLRLDAFWMRIGRAPLQDYGPAAMGELSDVPLHVEGESASGTFESHEAGVECRLQVRWLDGGLSIEHSDRQACYTGGANSVLNGRFWRVGPPSEQTYQAER